MTDCRYFDWAVNSIDVINCNFEGNHGIGIIANDGYAMRVEGCCFEPLKKYPPPKIDQTLTVSYGFARGSFMESDLLN